MSHLPQLEVHTKQKSKSMIDKVIALIGILVLFAFAFIVIRIFLGKNEAIDFLHDVKSYIMTILAHRWGFVVFILVIVFCLLYLFTSI